MRIHLTALSSLWLLTALAPALGKDIKCQGYSYADERNFTLQLTDGKSPTIKLEREIFPVTATLEAEVKNAAELIRCKDDQACIDKYMPADHDSTDAYALQALMLIDLYRNEPSMPASVKSYIDYSKIASAKFHLILGKEANSSNAGLIEYFDAQKKLLGRFWNAIEITPCR